MVKERQVVEALGSIWMFQPQYLFTDGQGTLIERFGLLVLALIIIEPCQSVETLGSVRMLRSQYLLTDCQGTLYEWLCLCVLPTFDQIDPCLLEQACCFWEGEIVLHDQ